MKSLSITGSRLGLLLLAGLLAPGCGALPGPDGQVSADSTGGYYLPWTAGVSYETTQGWYGDICGNGTGDHTGIQDYAWDFGLPRHTPVRATRGGTVTVAKNLVGPGQSCYDGCRPFTQDCCNYCLNRSNWVNVAHGDGTVGTYWHFDQVTVHPGQHVNTGDILGYSGTSGCSTGPHLHYMVMGNCPTGYCQSQPTAFVEEGNVAGPPQCGAVVTSRNHGNSGTPASGVGVAAGNCTQGETAAQSGPAPVYASYWTCQGNNRYVCDGKGHKVVESCPSGCYAGGKQSDDECNGGGRVKCTAQEQKDQTDANIAGLPSYWTCQGNSRYVCDGQGFKITETCPHSCVRAGADRDDQCQ